MKVILATGIFPPAIGGPATYTKHLAEELVKAGHEVEVVTFGDRELGVGDGAYVVNVVSRAKGSFVRWWRYASILKKIGSDADVVYCFSSVSTGVPLWLSGVKKPKRILRLGGDFLWERYTDRGGRLSLREWHENVAGRWSLVIRFLHSIFDYLVFSTEFQKKIYEQYSESLPQHSVIENAIPEHDPVLHQAHQPFRLLVKARFVKFKNLPVLIDAMVSLPECMLDIIGDGPERSAFESMIREKGLESRVRILKPLHGTEKLERLMEHDLFVVPSITDISPNAAIEARSAGLPVLMTQETGLSDHLTNGMIVKNLSDSTKIADAIRECMDQYDQYSHAAAEEYSHRSWSDVAKEHVELFTRLTS